MADRESLLRELRTKAKTADDRLRALEKLAGQEHFHGVLEFAYKGAMRDIRSWGGKARFSTRPPKTIQQIEAKIADIDKFLLKPSSSKRTIVKYYKQRTKTLNDKLGLKGKDRPTWQQWANFWESDVAQDMLSTFGSKTAVMLIAQFRKNKDAMVNAIKTADYSSIKVGPEFLQDTVEGFLNEYGVDMGDLFFTDDFTKADLRAAQRAARKKGFRKGKKAKK